MQIRGQVHSAFGCAEGWVSWGVPVPVELSLSLVCSNSCPLNWWRHLTLGWSPLLLPSVFPSIKVFSNKLAVRIRWPKYWGFSIRPSNEYSGLISFRIDKGKGERWIGYPPLNTNESLNVLTFCWRHYCFWSWAHVSEPCRVDAAPDPALLGAALGWTMPPGEAGLISITTSSFLLDLLNPEQIPMNW